MDLEPPCTHTVACTPELQSRDGDFCHIMLQGQAYPKHVPLFFCLRQWTLGTYLHYLLSTLHVSIDFTTRRAYGSSETKSNGSSPHQMVREWGTYIPHRWPMPTYKGFDPVGISLSWNVDCGCPLNASLPRPAPPRLANANGDSSGCQMCSCWNCKPACKRVSIL